jgi:hypothetical protein
MDDFNLGKLAEDSGCASSPPSYWINLSHGIYFSSDCVGGIIGVDPNSVFPLNLAVVGDIFMKSCKYSINL